MGYLRLLSSVLCSILFAQIFAQVTGQDSAVFRNASLTNDPPTDPLQNAGNLQDPLPIPPEAALTSAIDTSGPPLGHILSLTDVWMMLASTAYNASLSRVPYPVNDPFFNRDYTNHTFPGPMILFFPAMLTQPRQLEYREILWITQILYQRMNSNSPFVQVVDGMAKVPRMGYRFQLGSRVTSGNIRPVGSTPPEPDFPPEPVLHNIRAEYFPQAERLDVRAVFGAAFKAFKRVFVEDDTAVVGSNWVFREGDLEFQFLHRIGRPKRVTWKELSEAVMGLLQYLRTRDGADVGMKEARAFIMRGGEGIGRLDAVVSEKSTVTVA